MKQLVVAELNMVSGGGSCLCEKIVTSNEFEAANEQACKSMCCGSITGASFSYKTIYTFNNGMGKQVSGLCEQREKVVPTPVAVSDPDYWMYA